MFKNCSTKYIIIESIGAKMIKTTEMLIDEYKNYSNPAAKIDRMVHHGELTQIIRGLYSTDTHIQGHYLAAMIYGPSYLSFDYALSYHSLIPEGVRQYTSATFRKRRTKEYHTPFGIFNYRDIPAAAYPYGIEYHVEDGYSWQIASAEKAICDKLYTIAPLRNRKLERERSWRIMESACS